VGESKAACLDLERHPQCDALTGYPFGNRGASTVGKVNSGTLGSESQRFLMELVIRITDLPDLRAEPERHHRANDQASLAIVLRERTVDPAVQNRRRHA
jgi:hypothetical protein